MRKVLAVLRFVYQLLRMLYPDADSKRLWHKLKPYIVKHSVCVARPLPDGKYTSAAFNRLPFTAALNAYAFYLAVL